MTRADAVRDCLKEIVDVADDRLLAKLVMNIARSKVNDSGSMYELWCDDKGGCQNKCESELPCSEEDHIDCILRFLQQEHTPNQ